MAIISTFAGRTSANAYAYGINSTAPAGLLVLAGSTGTGAYTLTCQPQKSVNPNLASCVPTTNTPITVGQGSAAETVTPSAVSIDTLGNIMITATFSNSHMAGDMVRSGTVGLQEALNAVAAMGGGLVVVDGAWTKLGGTQAMFEASVAVANTAVEDLRNGTPEDGATLTLTAAQVNTMFTTPVELLPPPGANAFYIIQQGIFINENGGTAWTGGGVLGVGYGSAVTTSAMTAPLAAFLTGPTVTQVQTVAGAQLGSTVASLYLNQGIYINNATAVFATGTGVLKVKLLYTVVNL